MKFLSSLCLSLALLSLAPLAVADDPHYKPFVVASDGPGMLADKTNETIAALQAAGFEIAGQYSPVADTNIIVVTNEQLQNIAAASARGGYAAGQRVSVSQVGDNVEVSFINPVYMQFAYRLEADMKPVYDTLVAALGKTSFCGASGKKMTAKKLRKYHYMMGMQYFDDPSELASFASHEAAVEAVEKGLAMEGDALTRVYRIDIPGKDQVVFGIGMKMTNEDEKDIDETFQMSIVDFEGCKKRAYYPYELLVDGENVEALHMRFRMAVHFPNLSMMGKHGFTKLMSSPGAIEDVLEALVND